MLAGALVGCALALASALAASALASSLALDAPDNGTAPLVAYDSVSQTTYVAWEDPIKPAVDLCILPSGATSCESGAPVSLEDSLFTGDEFSGPGGLVVLPVSGEVAVIGDTTEHGSIAWISPAGGGAFLKSGGGLQNGGEPISDVSLFYTFGNAAALSSTDVGLLDDYGDFFGDTSLTSAAPVISKSNSNQKTSPAEGEFPRKALEAVGPEIAAEPAPAPAPAGNDIVVGVGDNYAGPSAALPGCLNKEGTGYGVSVGRVDGTSNAAGTLNAEGLPGYGVLACSAQAPVLAQGGADGIGLVEEEGDGIDGAGELFTVDYRPFDATATGGTFGAPVELADVTHESLGGVDGLDLAEDSATGIYASWLDEQGLVLDYSANGGASWEPPVVVPELASGVRSNPVIVGVGAGNLEIAYESDPGTGTQVFLESVNYAALLAASMKSPTPPPPPPPPPPPTPVSLLTIPKQSDDVTSKGDLSVVVDCSGAKCTGSLTLVAKVKKTTGKGKHKKTKTVVEAIGSVSFSSLALGTDTVALKLNGKGLSLLEHDGYKLNSTASSTYLSGTVFKTATGEVALKGHKPKSKPKLKLKKI